MAKSFAVILKQIKAAKKRLREKSNKKEVKRKIINGYYSKIARSRKKKVPTKPETPIQED